MNIPELYRIFVYFKAWLMMSCAKTSFGIHDGKGNQSSFEGKPDWGYWLIMWVAVWAKA